TLFYLTPALVISGLNVPQGFFFTNKFNQQIFLNARRITGYVHARMAHKLWKWFVESIHWCDHTHSINSGLTSWRNMKNIIDLIHVYRPDIVNAGDVTHTGQAKLYRKIFASVEMNCGIPLLFLDTEYYSEDNQNSDLIFLTYVVYLNAVFKDSSKNCTKKKIDSLALAYQMPFIRPCAKNSHSSSCIVCNERVFILERLIVDQQLRHRKCFLCVQCKQLLYIGLYKKSKNQMEDPECPFYECLEHEKESFLAKISMSVEEESTQTVIPAELKLSITSDEKENEQDRSMVCVENSDDSPIMTEKDKNDTLPDKLTKAAEDLELVISKNEDSEATNLRT
uniref:LIM zinc-binding domain-containing protein n=1 Tax=Romanomermis culicivorax TaxID=13658 RepID=A0A915J005_ROMCU